MLEKSHLGVCGRDCWELVKYSLSLLASVVAQMVKSLPAMQETRVWSLGWGDPLEKEMATHFSVFAWKISRMEEPGRLRSRGSQRVRHDSATNTFTTGLLSESWFSSGQQCVQVKTPYFPPLFVAGNDQFDVSWSWRIRDAGNGFKKLTQRGSHHFFCAISFPLLWNTVHGNRLQYSPCYLQDWRRKWQPTPVSLPEESQGLGSLVGCRLWGRTELDTTEAT